jgi:arylsulfatase A-like enzyme
MTPERGLLQTIIAEPDDDGSVFDIRSGRGHTEPTSLIASFTGHPASFSEECAMSRLSLRLSVLLSLWVLLSALPCCGLRAADPPRKPNIVILLADDLGFADVGFHGCKDIPTPNIDSIARNGVRFTNGYVSGPYCSPTRAGLLTGRYQNRFGHEFNPGGRPAGGDKGLPTSETTIADRLRAAGYRTGVVGKWHLGNAPKFHPQKRGFDEFFGFLGGAHTYFPGKGAPIYRGTTVVMEKEYLTDAFGREAVSFIDRNKDRPFFLYLAFNAVHTPMDATEARLKKFDTLPKGMRRTYAAMHSAMDDAVGRVLDRLRSAGIEENTLIFFLSDNGGPTMKGVTINASRNDPLRGSKRTTLEGGIRVPFAIQWKGKLAAGKVYEQPVIQLDILTTALAAAGVETRPEWKLDGVNLLPYLGGKKTGQPHDTLYWRFGKQMAIRRGDWKLVRYDLNAEGGKGVNMTPRLYHLGKDIGEKEDVAARYPDRVKELQSVWDSWNAQLVPPLWGGGAKKK